MMVVEIVAGQFSFDGAAGRRLAHEHACDGFRPDGGGVLFLPAPREGRAIHFWNGKDKRAGRVHECDCFVRHRVADGRRVDLSAGGPAPIHFQAAIIIASVGLAVNVASAWILKGDHHHHHHDHGHEHHHHGEDLNMRAAYLHVLADALTSVLAIVALSAGLFFGWVWLDP